MSVRGLGNLFVAGEKSGLFVGHIEAMATGALAGYNAVRYGIGMPLLTFPISTAIADIISYENYRESTIDVRKK